MNLAHPIRSVIPAVQGDVLAVLARTDVPLTGRGVAALLDGRASTKGVNLALRALVCAGLVEVESHPPANLYRLNRRHVAAEGIEVLANLRERLLDAMRAHVRTWDPAPWGVWLFGSAARGEGSDGSDIDVVAVRFDSATDDDGWWADIERFTDDVRAWSGNPCSVIVYSRSEFERLLTGSERLADELRRDAIPLSGRRLPRTASRTRT
jgi:predicted nucleotidyltransferase